MRHYLFGEKLQNRTGADSVLPAFTAAVSHMAKGNEDMPYAELRPADTGLMAEPLQTLQRLVPNMSRKDWDGFLEELNS